jgi:hypothetical protein|nr:MAG TPA: CMP/hydroxymethyl CMP hydrolase [Caudoviricetes sp.]
MDKKTCFVVSVIGKENSNEREHADSVFDYIIEPALSNEFEVTRADKMYHADKIDNKIFSSLQSSDLVVADLTGNNPNVFLEIGYRMALGKPIIFLVQKNSEPLPFDIQSINICHYDIKGDKPLPEATKAKKYIEETVKTFIFDKEEDTPAEEITTNELKKILLNIQNNLDTMNSRLLDGSYQTNNGHSFQQTLLKTALDDPDKVDRLLSLMSKYQKLNLPNE